VADENASGFTLRSVGFIGIGIASPGAMLDVYNTTASTPLVRFGRGVSDQSFLVQFVNGVAGGASGTEQGRVGLYYGASWNCGLRFLRGSGANDGPLALDAAGSERMRIDSTQATLSNSLKVNDSSLTGSAFAPLTVIGSIGVYSATTATAGAPIGASLYLSDNGFYYSGGYNLAPGLSAVYEVASGVSSALAFYTYASAGGRNERMRILSNGFVGINKTNPGYTLDVNGTLAGTSILCGNPASNNVVLNGGGVEWFVGTNARWLLYTQGTESGGNAGSDFYFASYSDAGAGLASVMVLRRSLGYVGIGKFPSYALDVLGDFQASGASILLTGLPSSNPGAGSKKLWYDPADSNRVKFAV